MAEIDNLWEAYDQNGQMLFTKIPNCFTIFLLACQYKAVQLRILLFIGRLSFGFNREETCPLNLDDFKRAIGVGKPQLSRNIKSLLLQQVIFRHSLSGSKYKYVINLLQCGIKMQHYRYGKVDCQIDTGVYQNGNIDCQLDKFKDSKTDLILYSKIGYINPKKPYIKEDRNLDRKKDNYRSSTALGSSINQTSNNNGNTSANTAAITLPRTQRPTRTINNEQLEKLYKSFNEEYDKNSTVDVVIKYMKILKENNIPYAEICDAYSPSRKHEFWEGTPENNYQKALKIMSNNCQR